MSKKETGVINQASARPKLSSSLKLWKYEIERLGRKYGLDFYPNIIVMANHEEISELAAYHGYPVRYHHWSFGQESIRMKKSYRWGLHIIYEMVVPTKPCYSYFLDTNPEVMQKAVIAHACVGHNDFFKNNEWFSDIPTNLHHRLGDNAEVIEKLRLEIGKDKVDIFLESCMSLDNIFNLLDPIVIQKKDQEKMLKGSRFPKRITSRDDLPYYMDEYLNPKEYIEQQRKKIEDQKRMQVDIKRKVVLPAEPTRDLLGFLLENAPLELWQQKVVRIIREESLAMMKGAQTKIMNEGWASYWESHIMAGDGAALDSEICSFCKSFAGVQKSSRYDINPYRLGKQLWDEIKLRWDTGRHGQIWNECKTRVIKSRWQEFIVFKSLYDEFGRIDQDMLKMWDQFTTLVNETKEGRGFINAAFFFKDQFVTEWLKYREASQKIQELKDALEYILKLEDKYMPSEDDGDLSHLDLRHKIMINSLNPYCFWSSDELRQEIEHYEFYASMKDDIEKGKLPVHHVDIPNEWIEWAKKYEFVDGLGKGLEKMFEVRKFYNDTMFVQDFFDQDFCNKYHYYTFGIGKNPPGFFWGEDRVIIKSRNYKRVKKIILQSCINLGQPKIVLLDANLNNNSELRLIHLHDGRDLCYDGCKSCNINGGGIKNVLNKIYNVWNKKKEVHIETIDTIWPEKKPPWHYWQASGGLAEDILEEPIYRWVRHSFDGERYSIKKFDDLDKVPDIERIKKLLPIIPGNLKKHE